MTGLIIHNSAKLSGITYSILADHGIVSHPHIIISLIILLTGRIFDTTIP